MSVRPLSFALRCLYHVPLIIDQQVLLLLLFSLAAVFLACGFLLLLVLLHDYFLASTPLFWCGHIGLVDDFSSFAGSSLPRSSHCLVFGELCQVWHAFQQRLAPGAGSDYRSLQGRCDEAWRCLLTLE